jgi:hypothetical protein
MLVSLDDTTNKLSGNYLGTQTNAQRKNILCELAQFRWFSRISKVDTLACAT